MKADSHLSAIQSKTSFKLVDNFGRQIDYLRLAVTERCNLRCQYCMPAEGVPKLTHHDILTFEEMERLTRILVEMGVRKVRITGGEPFVRKGLVPFLERLTRIPGLKSLHITTNGVETYPHLEALKKIGIAGINLSLDTLNPATFRQVTRRDCFEKVWKTIQKILDLGIPLKINCVVQRGVNEEEIADIARLAENNPIEIRFIEQMPFDGQSQKIENPVTLYEIEQRLKSEFPSLKKIDYQSGTAVLYRAEGFVGKLGVIGGYSRCFCAGCNRIRITPTGTLRRCLYDDTGMQLKPLLYANSSDDEIKKALYGAITSRFENGFEAERLRKGTGGNSMALIGG
ncbi:MAG: GTP 3',8-cyclase MoaA [Calditrichia bacterium]